MAMHADQLMVDQPTVRRLVDEQFGPWSGLAVRELRTVGTVNAIFRIGDELAARFPLREQDPETVAADIEAETAAMRELAAVSPVPVPQPVGIGVPGHGYPLPWSVQTWLDGHDAVEEDPHASIEFAHDLAAFIVALRQAPTNGRVYDGQGRGGHLPDHDAWMATCFEQSEWIMDTAPLREIWSDVRTLPEPLTGVMSHRDLIPPNVLVRDGRLVGVLDGGAFGPADPALDLVSAWHLLDAEPREVVREVLACGDIEWRRGMAWAFQQAMGLVWYYAESNPTMSRWGRRTLDRICDAWSEHPVHDVQAHPSVDGVFEGRWHGADDLEAD